MALLYDVATVVAAIGALGRAAIVLWKSLPLLRPRRIALRAQFGWAEAMAYPEPVLFAVVVAWLLASRTRPEAASGADVACAVAGCAVVVLAWVIAVWTLRSWPKMHTGHAVMQGQHVVTSGAYAVVRHPIYVAAFVMWAGLALAFRSLATFALLVLYVVPAYVGYARAEERMMQDAFGEEYARFRAAVPMLVPRLRRGRA